MEMVQAMPGLFTTIGLLVILLCVLFLPFLVKIVEHDLEIFLCIMGIVAVTISGLWSIEVIKTALLSPIHPKHPIVETVLLAGIIFTLLEEKLKLFVSAAEKILGMRLFIFLIISVLGIVSSVITAIVAALVLVEIVSILKFSKEVEVRIVVFACFAIGLGAALTPVGEPLSTILISRLRGEPYHAGFFFLWNNLAIYVIPLVIFSAFFAAMFTKKQESSGGTLKEDREEGYKDMFIRAGKVYIFIAGLEFLAKGFSPVVDYLVPRLKPELLYYINMISAILDNATLTAAEITPAMNILQIKSMLLSLLISGGMLIPGNIPNIITANKLKIGSWQWAKIGVPFGLVILFVYYIILFIVKI